MYKKGEKEGETSVEQDLRSTLRILVADGLKEGLDSVISLLFILSFASPIRCV